MGDRMVVVGLDTHGRLGKGMMDVGGKTMGSVISVSVNNKGVVATAVSYTTIRRLGLGMNSSTCTIVGTAGIVMNVSRWALRDSKNHEPSRSRGSGNL